MQKIGGVAAEFLAKKRVAVTAVTGTAETTGQLRVLAAARAWLPHGGQPQRGPGRG